MLSFRLPFAFFSASLGHKAMFSLEDILQIADVICPCCVFLAPPGLGASLGLSQSEKRKTPINSCAILLVVSRRVQPRRLNCSLSSRKKQILTTLSHV